MSGKLQVVRLDYLKDLGDQELVESLANLYLEQMEQTRSGLKTLYDNKAWFTFGKLCHKVKGSVVIFGMAMLANKLKILQLVAEQYARIDLEEKQSNSALDESELKILKELYDIDVESLRIKYAMEWPQMEEAAALYKETKDFSYVTEALNYSFSELEKSVDDVNRVLSDMPSYLR
jgi:hypothetical protein